MGFKVIMDWVANHTGMDNVWTVNKSWYNLSPEGDFMPPTGTDWTDVAQLNYNNADMRAAMIDAMKYWLKDFGIDGYRCDVADMVPVDFWEEATTQLRTIKPVYMLAEANNNNRLLNKAFQSDYNWNLLGLFNEIGKGNADAFTVNQLVSHQETWYPTGTYPMNFITNHDENSWNGTEYERLGNAVKPLTALYFTLPGIPLIYTGQEAALNRRLAFFEKDQVDWGTYSLQTYLQNLITLKKANRALWNGTAGGPYKELQTSTDSVLAFERTKASNRVIVVMNLTNSTKKVTISFGNVAGKYKAFSSNKTVTLLKSQTVQLKPWNYEIYTK
jgi:1,4-alpha-glucan branching enzyme